MTDTTQEPKALHQAPPFTPAHSAPTAPTIPSGNSTARTAPPAAVPTTPTAPAPPVEPASPQKSLHPAPERADQADAPSPPISPDETLPAESDPPPTPLRSVDSFTQAAEALEACKALEVPAETGPDRSHPNWIVDLPTHDIPLSQISLWEEDPRGQTRREEDVSDMAASINRHGLQQRILLRKTGPDSYHPIFGATRYLATFSLGHASIASAVVEGLSDRDALELAIIENLKRTDLNPIAEAASMARLEEIGGLTQAQVCERLNIKKSTYYARKALLRQPPAIQEAVVDGRIPPGHAQLLDRLSKNADLREAAFKRMQLDAHGGVVSNRRAKAIIDEMQGVVKSRNHCSEMRAGAENTGTVEVHPGITAKATITETYTATSAAPEMRHPPKIHFFEWLQDLTHDCGYFYATAEVEKMVSTVGVPASEVPSGAVVGDDGGTKTKTATQSAAVSVAERDLPEASTTSRLQSVVTLVSEQEAMTAENPLTASIVRDLISGFAEHRTDYVLEISGKGSLDDVSDAELLPIAVTLLCTSSGPKPDICPLRVARAERTAQMAFKMSH